MTWFRRIAFFIGLNIVVMLTLSFITSVLGIQPYLTTNGLNYQSLMVFCLIWGMGGAFISLLLSKQMAKWMMGVQIIDPRTSDSRVRGLVETVHRLARGAGLETMPEVGIYNSPEINAFATGPTRNRALVAVSSGLLGSMDSAAVEGVLGHEITHVANGDMVTMTLIQGVVNAFVMALARIIAFALDNFLRSRDRDSRGLGGISYYLVVMVLEMLLFIPGSMVVAYFSRQREYRADAGGARLAGRDKMVGALRALQRVTEVNAAPQAQTAPAFANMKIASGGRRGLATLFRTHPALEDRIARLEGRA